MHSNLKSTKQIIIPFLFILSSISTLQAKVIYCDDINKEIVEVKSHNRIDSVKLSFNLNSLSFEKGKYFINGLSDVNIENGAPDIPVIEKLVRIKNEGEVIVKILSFSKIDISEASPKAHRLSNSQSGLSAPELFDTVSFNFFEECNPVYLKSIEVIGDYRVARIAYSPVKFDNRCVNQIITSVDVLITINNTKSRSDFTRGRDIEEKRFTPFYKNILNVNIDDVRNRAENIVPIYSFIGNSSTLEAIQDLINWKIRKGLNVIVANTDYIGSSTSQIDSWIESTYQNNDGMMFVLLVGDEDVIPSNRMNCPYTQVQAPSDNAYGVIGGGYNPTVHVGRLTTAGKGLSIHEYQAWKIVEYESNPDIGPWMSKAETWGCSSPNGQPTASYWQNILEGAGMECNVELEADKAAKGMTLIGHFDEGLSTFAMKGHGNDESWTSANIGQSQITNMSNGMKQPWINNIACLNSRFEYSYYTCFAEAMMTTGSIGDAKGAIGMYSYTISSSGGGPTEAADGMLTAVYKGLYEEDMRHVGVAASYGTQSAGSSSDKKGSMVWGCPEMDIFFKYPLDTISVECENPVPGSFLVETDVEGALVSVVTQDYESLASGYTDASGKIILDLPVFNTPTYLTVTSRNCIPILREYDVTSLSGNLVTDNYAETKLSIKKNCLLINVSQTGKYDIKILDLKGRTLFKESCLFNKGNSTLPLKNIRNSIGAIVVELVTPQNKKSCQVLLTM